MGRDSAGTEIIRQTLVPAGAAAELRLTLDRDALPADGRAVCRFEIALLDARGAVVPDADTEVRVTLDGGMLLGMDNGNPAGPYLAANPGPQHLQRLGLRLYPRPRARRAILRSRLRRRGYPP